MSHTVLILGTDHRFQMRSPEFTEAQHQRFAAFVLATAKANGVAALAEENNPEALAEADVVESTIQFIARELGIKHRHCDPLPNKRAELGIRQENQIRNSQYSRQPANSKHPKPLTEEEVQQRLDESDRKREDYWLSKLVEFNTWPVLFVCGAEHSLPFRDLLQKNSLDTVLVAHDWST